MSSVRRSFNLAYYHDEAFGVGAPLSTHKLGEMATQTNAFLSRPQLVYQLTGYRRELLHPRPHDLSNADTSDIVFTAHYESSSFYRYAIFGEVSNAYKSLVPPRSCPKPPGKTKLIGALKFSGEADVLYNFQLLTKQNPTPQNSDNQFSFTAQGGSTVGDVKTAYFEVPCLPEEGEEIGLAVKTGFDTSVSSPVGIYPSLAYRETDTAEGGIRIRSSTFSRLTKPQKVMGKWMAVYPSRNSTHTGDLIYALAIDHLNAKLVRNDDDTASIWEYEFLFSGGQNYDYTYLSKQDIAIYYQPRIQILSLSVYTKEDDYGEDVF